MRDKCDNTQFSVHLFAVTNDGKFSFGKASKIGLITLITMNDEISVLLKCEKWLKVFLKPQESVRGFSTFHSLYLRVIYTTQKPQLVEHWTNLSLDHEFDSPSTPPIGYC